VASSLCVDPTDNGGVSTRRLLRRAGRSTRCECESYDGIGEALDVSGDTIRRDYVAELAAAGVEVLDRIEQNLLRMALGKQPTCAIFVSNCRLGYQENAPPPPGPPPNITVELVVPKDEDGKPVRPSWVRQGTA
jgi:hypothetical protein